MERLAILVVPDEETVRTLLSEFLALTGYQVRVAENGTQALEMLAAGSFDGVLLDVVLPDMSELEVLKRYRGAGGQAPVVVLCALSGADDAVRAMKLGATDYLPKPFANGELEHTLSRALGRNQESAGSWVRHEPPRSLGVQERNEVQTFSSSSPAMRRTLASIERVCDTVLQDPTLVPHAPKPSPAGAWVPEGNPFNMPQPPPPPMSIPEDERSLKDIGKRAAMLAEREAILAMLLRTAWNKRKAATRLRISYKALLYKIKESGIIDPRTSAKF